jgi:hypothetical protein
MEFMETTKVRKINGKVYTLWNQFVDRKAEWIGLRLQDFGDGMDQAMGLIGTDGHTTKITDITLEPNGDESAMFSVIGENFSCGFDVRHGGVGSGESGWVTFYGYGGHKWRIESLTKGK